MIKSNHNFIKHEQESTLEHRFYILVVLVITIKVITMFISLLTKTTNSILINHASTQKTNQTLSQKFETEVYFFIWNWQISDWENCWHVSESFLIICSKLELTSSYSHWARFLFHDWFSLYFICQFSRHVSLYKKKASACYVRSWKCEWNQFYNLWNLSFETSHCRSMKSLSWIHLILHCSWSQLSEQSDFTRKISIKRLQNQHL